MGINAHAIIPDGILVVVIHFFLYYYCDAPVYTNTSSWISITMLFRISKTTFPEKFAQLSYHARRCSRRRRQPLLEQLGGHRSRPLGRTLHVHRTGRLQLGGDAMQAFHHIGSGLFAQPPVHRVRFGGGQPAELGQQLAGRHERLVVVAAAAAAGRIRCRRGVVHVRIHRRELRR